MKGEEVNQIIKTGKGVVIIYQEVIFRSLYTKGIYIEGWRGKGRKFT